MSDPYESDWAAMGVDYGRTISAFEFAESLLQPVAKPVEIVGATLEAMLNLQAKQIHDKMMAEADKMLAAAKRVNQPNFHIQTVAQSQAMQDKARKLTGKSAGGAR